MAQCAALIAPYACAALVRACRRACRCRGEPRDCLARYAPLVPEATRDGVQAMIEGRRLDLDFDALRAEAPDAIAAVIEWSEQMRRSAAASRATAAARVAWATARACPPQRSEGGARRAPAFFARVARRRVGLAALGPRCD
jgi:hypothetical protein